MGDIRAIGLQPRRKAALACPRLSRPQSAPQLRDEPKKKKRQPSATVKKSRTSIKICLPPTAWPRVGRENSPDDCVGQKKSIEPKPVFLRLQRPTSAQSGLDKKSKYIILDKPGNEFTFKLWEKEKVEAEPHLHSRPSSSRLTHFNFEDRIRSRMKKSQSAKINKTSPMNLFGKLRGSKVKQKALAALPNPLTIKRLCKQKTISMRQLENATAKRQDSRPVNTRSRRRLTYQPSSMMSEQSLNAYRRRNFFKIGQTRPW